MDNFNAAQKGPRLRQCTSFRQKSKTWKILSNNAKKIKKDWRWLSRDHGSRRCLRVVTSTSQQSLDWFWWWSCWLHTTKNIFERASEDWNELWNVMMIADLHCFFLKVFIWNKNKRKAIKIQCVLDVFPQVWIFHVNSCENEGEAKLVQTTKKKNFFNFFKIIDSLCKFPWFLDIDCINERNIFITFTFWVHFTPMLLKKLRWMVDNLV
jgi:hypothetical protein